MWAYEGPKGTKISKTYVYDAVFFKLATRSAAKWNPLPRVGSFSV